jgi:hypothetical protein
MITTIDGLARIDKVRVWMRVLLFAVVFSLAARIGIYSVAPDGSYQIGPGTPSHDPSRYLWFFQQNVLGWGLLIKEALLFGSVVAANLHAGRIYCGD